MLLISQTFYHIQNTIKEWKIIFIIGGIAYILSALIFFIFGSGEIQSWNEYQPKCQRQPVESVKNKIDIDDAKI